MSNLPQAGYMGIAEIDGVSVRVTDFSVNATQDVQWYDHTIGLRDNIPLSLGAVKGDTGANQIQKHLWRAGTKQYIGSLSFYLAEDKADVLFNKAVTGDYFDMSFQYMCEFKRSFISCKVSSWTLNASAGDITTVSAEIWCLGIEEEGAGAEYDEIEKLITWDVTNIGVDGVTGDSGLSSFEVVITNNLKWIYTAGYNLSLSLNPAKIRVGMQEVSGNFVI